MKRFAATGSFHELLVVGVQIVEQQEKDLHLFEADNVAGKP